jgi:hypothetical protein
MVGVVDLLARLLRIELSRGAQALGSHLGRCGDEDPKLRAHG